MAIDGIDFEELASHCDNQIVYSSLKEVLCDIGLSSLEIDDIDQIGKILVELELVQGYQSSWVIYAPYIPIPGY